MCPPQFPILLGILCPPSYSSTDPLAIIPVHCAGSCPGLALPSSADAHWLTLTSFGAAFLTNLYKIATTPLQWGVHGKATEPGDPHSGCLDSQSWRNPETFSPSPHWQTQGQVPGKGPDLPESPPEQWGDTSSPPLTTHSATARSTGVVSQSPQG